LYAAGVKVFCFFKEQPRATFPGKTPDLQLFDEPYSALDPLTRAYIEGTRG